MWHVPWASIIMTGPLPIIQTEWTTIRAEQEKYCVFANSQASALGEHLLHNRLANVGPKRLNGDAGAAQVR